MSELKPCPFCGSSNIQLTTFMDPVHKKGGHMFGCGDCWQGGLDADCGFSTKEDAEAFWNTRTPIDGEALREVKKTLSRLMLMRDKWSEAKTTSNEAMFVIDGILAEPDFLAALANLEKNDD